MGDLRTLNWNLGWKIDANPIENADKKTDELDKKVKGLEKDTEKASKTSALGFGNIGSGIKKVVGLAAGLGTGFGLLKLGEDAIEAGDKTYKLSQKMGISAGEASNLNRILSLTDTDSKPFISSMMKLDKSIETVGVHGNATTKQLSEFGVNLLDAHGKLLPINDQLGVMAESYKKAEEAGNGEAYATSIFGAKAQQMIPLLEDYADAKEAASKVKGIGIDPKAAHEATVNMKALKMEVSQAGMTVSNAFMPVISTVLPYLLTGFTDVATFTNTHQKDIQGFTKGFADFGVAVGKEVMPVVTGSLIPTFKNDVVPMFKNDLIPVFKNDLVPILKNDVIPLVGDLAKHGDVLVPIIGGLAIAVGAYNVVMGIAAIRTGAMNVVQGIKMVQDGLETGYIVALYVAQGIHNGVLAAGTTAQWLFNAAMDANPIGVVIVGLGLLGGAIYEVVKHWQDICTWVEKAWGWLTKWNDTPANDKGASVTMNKLDGGRGVSSKSGYATGTNYATPGLHWVGENGPELMSFRGGETVLNNNRSQQLINTTQQVFNKSLSNDSPVQQPQSNPAFSPTIHVHVDGSDGNNNNNNDLVQKIKKTVSEVIQGAIEDYHQSLLTKTPLAVER